MFGRCCGSVVWCVFVCWGWSGWVGSIVCCVVCVFVICVFWFFFWWFICVLFCGMVLLVVGWWGVGCSWSCGWYFVVCCYEFFGDCGLGCWLLIGELVIVGWVGWWCWVCRLVCGLWGDFLLGWWWKVCGVVMVGFGLLCGELMEFLWRCFSCVVVRVVFWCCCCGCWFVIGCYVVVLFWWWSLVLDWCFCVCWLGVVVSRSVWWGVLGCSWELLVFGWIGVGWYFCCWFWWVGEGCCWVGWSWGCCWVGWLVFGVVGIVCCEFCRDFLGGFLFVIVGVGYVLFGFLVGMWWFFVGWFCWFFLGFVVVLFGLGLVGVWLVVVGVCFCWWCCWWSVFVVWLVFCCWVIWWCYGLLLMGFLVCGLGYVCSVWCSFCFLVVCVCVLLCWLVVLFCCCDSVVVWCGVFCWLFGCIGWGVVVCCWVIRRVGCWLVVWGWLVWYWVRLGVVVSGWCRVVGCCLVWLLKLFWWFFYYFWLVLLCILLRNLGCLGFCGWSVCCIGFGELGRCCFSVNSFGW